MKCSEGQRRPGNESVAHPKHDWEPGAAPQTE
jgi:hypothetical protein